jgi:hypothetical protein
VVLCGILVMTEPYNLAVGVGPRISELLPEVML